LPWSVSPKREQMGPKRSRSSNVCLIRWHIVPLEALRREHWQIQAE